MRVCLRKKKLLRERSQKFCFGWNKYQTNDRSPAKCTVGRSDRWLAEHVMCNCHSWGSFTLSSPRAPFSGIFPQGGDPSFTLTITFFFVGEQWNGRASDSSGGLTWKWYVAAWRKVSSEIALKPPCRYLSSSYLSAHLGTLIELQVELLVISVQQGNA